MEKNKSQFLSPATICHTYLSTLLWQSITINNGSTTKKLDFVCFPYSYNSVSRLGDASALNQTKPRSASVFSYLAFFQYIIFSCIL